MYIYINVYIYIHIYIYTHTNTRNDDMIMNMFTPWQRSVSEDLASMTSSADLPPPEPREHARSMDVHDQTSAFVV